MGKRIFCDGLWPLFYRDLSIWSRRENWLRQQMPHDLTSISWYVVRLLQADKEKSNGHYHSAADRPSLG